MSTSLDFVRTNKNLVFFKCQQSLPALESGQTKEVLQRVESDATLCTLDSSLSFEFLLEVTHDKIM